MLEWLWNRTGRFISGPPTLGGRINAVPARPPYVTRERLEAGLVICLDGVGGWNRGPRWTRRGLSQGGIRQAIAIYHWSFGPISLFLADLLSYRSNRAKARRLAQAIVDYQNAAPGRPVTIIGHSGGCAIATWALEALPEGHQVERAFLLAPALWPGYNLAPALRAVRTRLHVMYSYTDLPLMALGTLVCGTMDRRHSVSAGLVGFRLPRDLSDEDGCAYAKVRQVRWNLGLTRFGNMGDHMGWTWITFARTYLAPILKGERDPGTPMVDLVDEGRAP